MFDEKTKQELRYYVYALLDPFTNRPFYIGKGKDDRVFAHVNCELEIETPNDKYKEIWKIKASGNTVRHIILRHGLSEKQAFEIEATLIDFLHYLKHDITNIVGGHKSIEKGLMTTDEIIRLYNAEELNSIEPDCVIININQKYERGSGSEAIYDATKGTWAINKIKADKIKYVLSEYRGLIIEVFEVEKRLYIQRGYNPKAKNFGKERTGFGFEGKVAPEEIRCKYVNKSIAHHKKRGAATAHRFTL